MKRINDALTPAADSKIGFLLLWVGMNLGVWLLWVGSAAVLNPALSSALFSYVLFFLLGLALGFGQWLLVRQRFSIVWYEWVPGTAVGLGVGLIGLIWAALQDQYIILSTPGSPILEWDPLLGGAILGLAVGLCQSISWRPIWGQALLWIVLNGTAWAVGMFLPQWFVIGQHTTVNPLVSTLFPVTFSALVTGVVLILLSGRRANEF